MQLFRVPPFVALMAIPFLAACSGESSPALATGGARSTGGVVTTGGAMGSGGANATGGNTATGGSRSTGGNAATGGNTNTGGGTNTGGSHATGGNAATGGDAATGGSHATGGNTATGGTPDAGVRDTLGPETARDAQAPDTQDTNPPADAKTNTNTVVTVYIAGDSTVSTYTNSSIKQGGWGQFLQSYFIANAKIVNKAVGGMTARHFIEAGYLDQILAVIKAGDYLLVQFGTNDGNKTATYTYNGKTIPYYLDPATDFRTYLKKYVDATKAKGATTLFVTPPPRHSCSGTDLGVANGTGGYATAMKELGPTLDTKVADLNGMVIDYLSKIACDVSGKTFFLVRADGSIDSTHFQENGANIMAGLVAKGSAGISTLGLPLSAYVK